MRIDLVAATPSLSWNSPAVRRRFSPASTRRVRIYRHWHESIDSTHLKAVTEDHRLTRRELTILALLAQARTAHGIARHLGISYRTVNKHVQNLYANSAPRTA